MVVHACRWVTSDDVRIDHDNGELSREGDRGVGWIDADYWGRCRLCTKVKDRVLEK
jgi:hypothetical protein